jgi:hypothetical protein
MTQPHENCNRAGRPPSDRLLAGVTVTENPFLVLAARQMSSPTKARQRAAAKRAASKAQSEGESEKQAKVWRAWRRERREALLAGPHGADAKALLGFLRSMTLDSAAELVEAVGRGPWRQADDDTRFEILALVDEAIIALRERHELDPFDDALPFTDEAPTAFLQIREALR